MKSMLFNTATSYAASIKNKSITSLDLVKAHIAYIKKHNGRINAVIHLDEENALAQARLADERIANGMDMGPLHGVPMTIKDAFRIKGVPTTYGLPQYKNYLPKEDCEMVRRLKNSGAIVIGKTNLPFASFDWQCRHPNGKEGKNPWNQAHTPGGSSGGSAASVAAGFSPIELGSDIAGSIRYPAHCCGVLGLRTTDGLLPSEDWGPEDLETAFHRIVTCGPLARNVDDLILLLQVLDTNATPPIKDIKKTLRIAYTSSILGVDNDQATQKHFETFIGALKEDGHQCKEKPPEGIDFEECYRIWGHIVGYEYRDVLPRFFKTAFGRILFDGYFLNLRLGNGRLTRYFKAGLNSSEDEYQKVLLEHQDVAKRMKRFMSEFDLWILPTSPSPAILRSRYGSFFKHNGQHKDYSSFLGNYLTPTALLGTPALNVPIGFAEGLPIGVQVHGAPFSDHRLLQITKEHLEKYIAVKWPDDFGPPLPT